MAIPATTERVTLNTAPEVNHHIQQQTERNIAYYAAHPDEIDARLKELDQEWDIERTLETQAAGLTVVSTVFGALISRKWFVMPFIVGGFLLQHAIQGWCPPVPLFRRMGVRTQNEIERERYALKAIRGDFNEIRVNKSGEASAARASRQILEAVK